VERISAAAHAISSARLFSDAFARQVAMKCEGVLFVPFSPSGMLHGPSERASSEDKSTTEQPEDS
jgi:hypothetical protein